jgi:hypothetical protein
MSRGYTFAAGKGIVGMRWAHAKNQPAERVVAIPSEEDGADHKIYVWTAPVKR